MKDQKEIVACLFDYFYYKLYKYPYKLDLETNDVNLSNYLIRLSKHYSIHSLGISFFYSYFCFAFEYWSKKTTKRKITLGWIIGKKMIGRWVCRPDSSKYFVDKFIKEYDIDINHVIENLIDDGEQGLDPAEEIEKTRHSQAQLLHCIHFTTLYNHRSKHCISCKEKVICKRLLKSLYPQTYKNRGYEGPVR